MAASEHREVVGAMLALAVVEILGEVFEDLIDEFGASSALMPPY